jgi:hypothetical protein
VEWFDLLFAQEFENEERVFGKQGGELNYGESLSEGQLAKTQKIKGDSV